MTTTTEIKTTQVFQVFIKATPELVWEAITKPEFTEKYFHAAKVELKNGRRVSHGPNGELWGDEEILVEDPPRRLVHSWRSLYDPEMAAEEPSRVTWEIDAEDGGVSKLTVVHDQLEGAPKTAESIAGWTYILSGLKTLLETGEPLAE
jgi:uncharacterized protein YndB with AHSA1/START domain